VIPASLKLVMIASLTAASPSKAVSSAAGTTYINRAAGTPAACSPDTTPAASRLSPYTTTTRRSSADVARFTNESNSALVFSVVTEATAGAVYLLERACTQHRL
jgi:hypothetical protein